MQSHTDTPKAAEPSGEDLQKSGRASAEAEVPPSASSDAASLQDPDGPPLEPEGPVLRPSSGRALRLRLVLDSV